MKTQTCPNRENCREEELESYIKLAKTPMERCRLSAIKMLWRGMSALDVAECLSVTDVSIYNWITRFNLKGLDGLLNRYRGGRPRLVSIEQVNQHINVFEEPQKAGELHWSAKKFHGHLKKVLNKEFSYQTTLNYLHQSNYAMKYGRCWPDMPEGNEDKRKEFINNLEELERASDIKIWYMDEAGFDGDPRARRGWYKKGERKKIYRTQKHLRMNVAGMCCPKTGEFFALEFPYSDRRTFQCFLSSADKEIPASHKQREIMILDNVYWTVFDLTVMVNSGTVCQVKPRLKTSHQQWLYPEEASA